MAPRTPRRPSTAHSPEGGPRRSSTSTPEAAPSRAASGTGRTSAPITHAVGPATTPRDAARPAVTRRAVGLAALGGTAALGLAACGVGGSGGSGGSGGADGEDGEGTVVKVASHLPPMTDVVEVAAGAPEAEGFTIELVQVSDNVQYNRLLADGEVDANFAQHEPYMTQYNEENDGSLVKLASIYDAKVGYYSKAYSSVEEIPEGAKVAIPNDVSNEGRALAILHEHGVLTLPDGTGFEGVVSDIVENPLDLEFVQVDLLNLASAYDEDGIALVYNYPTYISKVGLTPADALLLEETVDQRFAISLVAREDNQDSPGLQALTAAMTSDTVRAFLEDEHSETLLPSF